MAEKITSTHSWFMERRHFSLIIASAFVILSAVTFFLCYRHHAIDTEQTLKEDRASASLLSLVLDEHLKKLVSVMESYVQRPLLLQAVRDKNAEKARMHLINLKKNNPDVDILIITDRWGTLWAAYPERPESVGVNFAYRDWYKGVSKEWKPNISDAVLRVVEEKDLAVQISIPFVDETGKVIGILTNTQRTVGLSYLFKRVLLDPGAFITVTDRKGQIVYNSLHDVEKELKPYPFQPGIKKAMAAKKDTFAVDAPDLTGRTRYISFAPVVSSGWTVFVERDKRGILLSESSYYSQVTTIAFLLFLSIILFLVYSRKQVAAQQVMEQLEAAKKIHVSEVALQESERRLREAQKMAQLGHWIWDIKTGNVEWSEEVFHIFQLDPKIFTPHIDSILALSPWPEDHERDKELIRRAMEAHVKGTYEQRFLRPDNSIGYYHSTFQGKYDDGDNLVSIVGTVQDITERKQAEEVSKKEQALSNAIIESIPGTFYMLDETGQYVRWNAYQRDEIVGKPDDLVGSTNALDTIHPDDRGLIQSKIVNVLANGVDETIEGRVLLRGGPAFRWLVMTGCRMLIDGHPFLVGIGIDITERKQAEEELRQQTEELRASNDELELFNSAATGRELRMIELKEEINELCHRLGEPPRHAIDQLEIDRVAGAGPTPAEPGGGGA